MSHFNGSYAFLTEGGWLISIFRPLVCLYKLIMIIELD